MSGAKKRVPKRRFKEFLNAGDWEQRKLGECVDISTGYPFDSQDFNENGEYLVITNGNIQDNTPFVLNNVGNRIDLDDSLKKYILDIDDLLITMDGTVGRVAIVVDNKLVLAQRVCRIKSNEPYYIYQLLSKNDFIQSMDKIGHGGTIKHISLSEISEYQAFYPKSQKERIKISTVLTNYNKLITLHQCKLDKLQATKKALLQEMFPEEGQDKPKRRFKGFAAAWEQRKLDELTISIGDGLHGTPKYDENGSYYFINGNNLADSKVSVTTETKKVAFEALSNDDRRLDSTSILMSINGTIGTLARYNNENIMLGKSVAYITPKNINRDFLFYQLQGNVIQSYFYKNLTGTTIKNLGLGTIKNAIVMSTLSEEEYKIGQFFYKLDQFITLHQRKLDKLKNLKQAYLNEMFV